MALTPAPNSLLFQDFASNVSTTMQRPSSPRDTVDFGILLGRPNLAFDMSVIATMTMVAISFVGNTDVAQPQF